MLSLDMKTVMYSNSIIYIVCLIVMCQLWWQSRSKFAGINFWVADWALQLGAGILIIFRGTAPDWASMVLSNTMIIGGTLALFFGLCRFAGKKSHPVLTYIIFVVFALFIATHSYFTFVQNELLARNYNLSIALVFSCLPNIWLMFKGVNSELRPVARGTGIAFVAVGIISLIRIINFSLAPQSSNDFFQSGLFDTLLVLLLGGSFTFLTFNLVLMVNTRLNLETKQGEEKVRETSDYLNNLLDYANAPIIVWDPQFRITRFNHAFERLTGRLSEEVVGTKLELLFPPETRDKSLEFIRKTVVGEHWETVEIPIQNVKGSVRTVLWNSATLYSRNHQAMIATIAQGQDITERKRAEARALEVETLRQLNKAKNELLTNVSHELRTPLSSIKGFIETLMQPDVTWGRKQQLEFLNDANREADHLTLLIRNLLDMSRIESGKILLEKKISTFDEILEVANARLKSLTENHRLIIEAPPNLPPLLADKVRLAQVLTNLVENAAKFSAEGSSIIIRVQEKDDEAVFSVVDQGIGISRENMGKLFDKFFQVENAVAGKTGGTGLGLAICKGIVEAHGGKIWAESEPGKGSTFSFSIPLVKEVRSV
jgi:PAS domain S-box-containing protein